MWFVGILINGFSNPFAGESWEGIHAQCHMRQVTFSRFSTDPRLRTSSFEMNNSSPILTEGRVWESHERLCVVANSYASWIGTLIKWKRNGHNSSFFSFFRFRSLMHKLIPGLSFSCMYRFVYRKSFWSVGGLVQLVHLATLAINTHYLVFVGHG